MTTTIDLSVGLSSENAPTLVEPGASLSLRGFSIAASANLQERSTDAATLSLYPDLQQQKPLPGRHGDAAYRDGELSGGSEGDRPASRRIRASATCYKALLWAAYEVVVSLSDLPVGTAISNSR
jgi:hypothetical protein